MSSVEKDTQIIATEPEKSDKKSQYGNENSPNYLPDQVFDKKYDESQENWFSQEKETTGEEVGNWAFVQKVTDSFSCIFSLIFGWGYPNTEHPLQPEAPVKSEPGDAVCYINEANRPSNGDPLPPKSQIKRESDATNSCIDKLNCQPERDTLTPEALLGKRRRSSSSSTPGALLSPYLHPGLVTGGTLRGTPLLGKRRPSQASLLPSLPLPIEDPLPPNGPIQPDDAAG